MRSLELSDSDDGLDMAFADIETLAAECRFRDCAHSWNRAVPCGRPSPRAS